MADLGKQYESHELSGAGAESDPIHQFRIWFDFARSSGAPEANAMTLATSGKDGSVSARIVLLRGFDAKGFRFFTNYESLKGRQLSENPQVALLFFWPTLERQIRIEGVAARLPESESDAYFHGRPREHQLAALASPQSTIIPNRTVLDQDFEKLKEKYKDESPIARPSHWGGYLVRPVSIEFWQSRPYRLHDRLRYQRVGEQDWRQERLAP